MHSGTLTFTLLFRIAGVLALQSAAFEVNSHMSRAEPSRTEPEFEWPCDCARTVP